MFSTIWNTIKDWSGWSTNGTIFMRRLEVLGGAITAGLMAALNYDWLPYFSSTDGQIHWQSMAMIAGYLTASGLFGELVRRWNAKDI